MHLPLLDAREEHFRITGPHDGAQLFLRRLTPKTPAIGTVLYLHGATFPSALSIAHRFDGRSWRDALVDAGFSVWALDFQGFGGSDPWPQMTEPADDHPPAGLAADAALQVASAVHFILAHEQRSALSLITHSWGSMPAGLFAGDHPALVDRWVLFAPLARRVPSRYLPTPTGPAWRLIGAEDQWNRFVEDLPADEPPVLSRRHFDEWIARYLESDAGSAARVPPSVKTPSGPFIEILRAWHGELAYDPGRVRASIAIIRGAWDGLCTDDDARWLFDAFRHAPVKRDVKIARGTHLMHLEAMRQALGRESVTFLTADDVAVVP